MKPRRKSVEPGAVFAESAWRSKEKNFLKDLFQGFRGNVLASLVASAITAAAGYFWGALSGISYVDIPVDSRKAAAPGIFWNYKIAFAEVVTLDNKYYQDAGFSPVAEELQSAFGSRRPNLNIVARRTKASVFDKHTGEVLKSEWILAQVLIYYRGGQGDLVRLVKLVDRNSVGYEEFENDMLNCRFRIDWIMTEKPVPVQIDQTDEPVVPEKTPPILAILIKSTALDSNQGQGCNFS